MTGAPLIVGGGETGELLRSNDWRTSRLGPATSWPPTLRISLGLAFASRLPIAIYWGPEYVMLYNDELRPMVGASKHPQAFGRPAFEALPEIRGLIEPLLDQVVATGEPVWSEDLMQPMIRHEAPEESYFTFNYSPIRTETGEIGGVFCAAIETTDKVIQGRRLRLLNAMADATRAKNPSEACEVAAAQLARDNADVPFALLYLLDDDATTLTRAGIANLEVGDRHAPETIRIGDDSIWPFGRVLASDRPLELAFDTIQHGARGVVILPIERPGGGTPLGFIVAALGPMLRTGPSYARFHNLLAASISQSVSNATAYNLERTQRTRLYRHFMQAPFPVCVFRGATHVIDLANPEMLAAWSAGAEVVGKVVREALPWMIDTFVPLLDGVFTTGTPYEGRAVRVVTPSGEHYFDFIFAPLHDEHQRAEGVLVSAFEVTDAVKSRQTAEESAAAQRTVREFQERFVAVLGHDLRNPLAAIAMGTGVLEQQLSDPKIKRVLTRINSSTRRMSRMVEQILDLSRARMGGGISIVRTPVDLRQLASAVIDEAIAAHPDRAIELVGPSLNGMWDRDRLEQVVANLIGNAIHHGEATPITVTITARGINVHNDGAAIPERDAPDLVRAVPSGRPRQAQQAFGGPRPGPVHHARDRARTWRIDRRHFGCRRNHVLGRTGETMNHTVLVVEDERELREMMQDALEMSGYSVVAARDGQEALERLGDIDQLCLVVLDLVMPRMNGWDFYAQLRAHNADVPVVVHSSAGTKPPAGVALVLQKPIEFADLVSVVKTYCT